VGRGVQRARGRSYSTPVAPHHFGRPSAV
jgi:hypothetical protein